MILLIIQYECFDTEVLETNFKIIDTERPDSNINNPVSIPRYNTEVLVGPDWPSEAPGEFPVG